MENCYFIDIKGIYRKIFYFFLLGDSVILIKQVIIFIIGVVFKYQDLNKRIFFWIDLIIKKILKEY